MPLTVTAQADVIALVPHLLGVHPRDALVVVAVQPHHPANPYGPKRVLTVTATPLTAIRDSPTQAAARMATTIPSGLRRVLIPVIYLRGDVATAKAGTSVATAASTVAQLALHTHVPTVRPWVVTETGYYQHGCEDPGCCPPKGRPLACLPIADATLDLMLTGSAPVTDLDALLPTPHAGPLTRDHAHARTLVGTGDEARIAREVTRRLSAATSADPVGLLAALAEDATQPAITAIAAAHIVEGGHPSPALLQQMFTDLDTVAATIRRMTWPLEPGAVPPPAPHLRNEFAVTITAMLAASAHVSGRARATLLLSAGVLAWWCGQAAVLARMVGEVVGVDPDNPDIGALLVLPGGATPSWRSVTGQQAA